MAYQNVGTPRFYVNVLEWLASKGYDALPNNTFRTLPVNVQTTTGNSGEGDYNFLISLGFNSNSFYAVLGLYPNGSWKISDSSGNYLSLTGAVNPSGELGQNCDPDRGGWSLGTFNGEGLGSGWHLITTGMPSAGSIILGTYYDMPHSPDLKLTMTREMDGVKRIRTKGGTDLVKQQYTGNPDYGASFDGWGFAEAWELWFSFPEHQSLSRSGRRVWDLSFSYLQDSDLFPEISNLEEHGTDYDSSSSIGKTLLDDNSFYSQVIHKTNGGQLPFIFQPDAPRLNPLTGLYEGGNSNPDNFAICKFDNSFSFQQTAPNLYSVKMKIREVW